MTNDATRASDAALPKITRRAALAAIPAVAVAPAAAAAPPPAITPREQAIWHIRQLERLALDDGGVSAVVSVTATYGSGVTAGMASFRRGQIVEDGGMFQEAQS